MGGYNPVEWGGVCELERSVADSPTIPGSHFSRKDVRIAVHLERVGMPGPAQRALVFVSDLYCKM